MEALTMDQFVMITLLVVAAQSYVLGVVRSTWLFGDKMDEGDFEETKKALLLLGLPW